MRPEKDHNIHSCSSFYVIQVLPLKQFQSSSDFFFFFFFFFWICVYVWGAVGGGPFKVGRLALPFSTPLHLQAICPQVVSQASQHFTSSLPRCEPIVRVALPFIIFFITEQLK